jgi:hypothetical protein
MPLCWFGIGAEPGRLRPATDPRAIGPKVISPEVPRTSHSTRAFVAALVVVATTMIAVLSR